MTFCHVTIIFSSCDIFSLLWRTMTTFVFPSRWIDPCVTFFNCTYLHLQRWYLLRVKTMKYHRVLVFFLSRCYKRGLHSIDIAYSRKFPLIEFKSNGLHWKGRCSLHCKRLKIPVQRETERLSIKDNCLCSDCSTSFKSVKFASKFRMWFLLIVDKS